MESCGEKCRLCNELLPKKHRRTIFTTTFSVTSQLVEVLGYVPAPEDGRSAYVCGYCYTKLNKIAKIDFELAHRLNLLKSEKQTLVAELRAKLGSQLVSEKPFPPSKNDSSQSALTPIKTEPYDIEMETQAEVGIGTEGSFDNKESTSEGNIREEENPVDNSTANGKTNAEPEAEFKVKVENMDEGTKTGEADSVANSDKDKKKGETQADSVENMDKDKKTVKAEPDSVQNIDEDKKTVETEPDEDKKTVETEAPAENMDDDGNVEDTKGDDSVQDKAEPDEYLYTKRDGFTSEIYKISITNLPKKFGFAELKKKLTQQDLKPVKLKVWKDVCFVTFRNEEEKDNALTKMNGYKWKGHELKAVAAKPAADPLMRKRKQEQNQRGSETGDKKAKIEDDGLSPAERLKNSVTPLWKLPYEEQLKKKDEDMMNFMKKYLKQIDRNCPDLRRNVQQWKKQFNGMPCELQSIKPSPQTEGYRNKCEFTIGPGIEGESNVVGFRFGQYSQGTVFVGSPNDVNFLSDTMKTVVKNFQAYFSKSQYGEFNPENHTGHWRQLAVRTSRLGHIMVMIDFHPQSLSQEEIDQEKERIQKYFTDGDGKDTGITSCYFRSHSERMTGAPSDSPYNLVFGDECITEQLLEMEFRISPNAFFQVNTGAAEVLYKQVSDWCDTSSSSTVLDVCCGTGTIGLTVAKSVEKVIGIEMCSQAIQDAKVNADKNSVDNVTYHCAKAEDVMKDITRSIGLNTDVIAIVDPPRSGLHSSVLVAIRNCRSINRLVYVSCNVNGALNNFIDLVRPTSKRLKGSRFLPVKAIPVDLFPHTNHCELVLLFEREKCETNMDDSD